MAADAAARRRWGLGAAIVLVVGAAAVTVGVGVVRQAATPVEILPPAAASPVSPSTVAGASVYVHVTGAVRMPGLYRMAADARVVDAVAAAGGLADDADPAGVNLARAVADGEQLVVPRVGEAVPAAPGAPAGAPRADGKVDLNTADAAALDTLPRIGPAIAARIIAWRDEHGRFTSVEDLLAVPGIGPKLLEGLRDLVVV